MAPKQAKDPTVPRTGLPPMTITELNEWYHKKTKTGAADHVSMCRIFNSTWKMYETYRKEIHQELKKHSTIEAPRNMVYGKGEEEYIAAKKGEKMKRWMLDFSSKDFVDEGINPVKAAIIGAYPDLFMPKIGEMMNTTMAKKWKDNVKMKELPGEDEMAEIPTLSHFRGLELLDMGIKAESVKMKTDTDLQRDKEIVAPRTPMAARAKDAMTSKRKAEEAPAGRKRRFQLDRYNVRQLTVEDSSKKNADQLIFLRDLFPSTMRAAMADGTIEVPDFTAVVWEHLVGIITAWDFMMSEGEDGVPEQKAFWMEFQ